MPIDWTKIYQQYKGLWVALEEDEQTVISAGKTLSEALQRAKEAGKNDPIITKMPNELIGYIGTFCL